MKILLRWLRLMQKTGVATTASSDTEEVNAGENDDALSDDDIFLEDDENEDSDNELQEDDEDVDIDDEDNDKLDLIMKIIGIGIAVIILIVTIFVIVKLVGSTKSPKNENTETVSTTEEMVSTANSKDTVTVPKVEGMTKDRLLRHLMMSDLDISRLYRALRQWLRIL